MNRENFIIFDKQLHIHKPRLIRGPSGIGKTTLIEDISQLRHSRLIVLHLADYEPADLTGLPEIVDHRTCYAQPWWWPEQENCILLLDELDGCREEMHAVAMQLLLRRQVGPHILPKDTIIYATANGGKFIRTIPIDQALMRRCVVIDYTPAVDEWLKWADENKIHSLVLDYIRANPGALDTPAEDVGKPDQQIPCRSTWADFGQYLESIKGVPDNLVEITKGFIGQSAALDFESWYKYQCDLLKPEEVFTKKFDAKQIDVLQAARVADLVAKQLSQRSSDEQRNALGFFKDAGAESFAALLAALKDQDFEIIHKFPEIEKFADELI